MQILSARTIAAQVGARSYSAEQIATETLARAAAYDAIQPQAWIYRLPHEQVLAQARRVDERVAAGEQLPLAGVPFAVKDNIDAAGIPTTAACPEFSYVPGESATVVGRLMAAGAVLIGKTNLDQFATGLVGTRSPYGAPTCVFNRDYVSGGSSSGSAVLVAAGVVAFALGSDTAGSGRVPAAFNNLFGLKPTKGRWSSRGMVPACRSLDCITTLTNSADDAALVDQVSSAFDPADAYSRREPAARDSVGASFRFGVPRPEQLNFFGDEEAPALFRAARDRLVRCGGKPVEIDMTPLTRAAQLLYSGPWVAERTAALEEFLKTHSGAIHPVVRAIVQGGKGVSAVEAFKGFYALQAYMRDAEAMWEGIDVLLLPTTPTIYRVSELLAEPVGLNSNLGFYTNFVNLLDMSAVAVPAGFRGNATGFGVSLIGPAWTDRALLDLARRYETVAPLPAAPDLCRVLKPKTIELAVVGAHLAGMPLHWQLTSRAARLSRSSRTAPTYRLYAMKGTTPPKPALVHSASGGGAIELEVYELEVAAFGSFVAEVPAPLAIGTVVLEDGSTVHGFVAEPRAMEGAEDITAMGGWRAYMSSR